MSDNKISISEILMTQESRFLRHLGIPFYQILLYEYRKRGIYPIEDQSIIKRPNVDYIKVDLNDQEGG